MQKFVLLAFVFVLLAAAPASADAPDWSQPVFGVVEAADRPDEAAQLGVEWERLIFHWHLFQPNGPEDFNTDGISNDALANARAAGRQVVGLIKGTPQWASDSRTLGGVPHGLDLPYDDPNNVFAQFVTRLVTHYSQQGIHEWIIWNEPDIRPGEGVVEFEGEVEDYFLLLKSAYLAAHAADPDAHIQVAGLTWWYDLQHGRVPYFERLLNVISADPDAAQHGWYFDGVTAHIYFTTSSIPMILGGFRTLLAGVGLQDKELWLAEFNASPRRDPANTIVAPFNLSLEQQADFIVQASALALAEGVDRMAVFKMYDTNFTPGRSENWGLVRADGTLRPAFQAYQRVIDTFSGAYDVQRYRTWEAEMITLRFSNRTVHVLWNDTFSPGEFLLYTGGIVTVTDAVGTEWTVESEGGVVTIDAPAAEQVDMPDVVVAGAVRIVTLPGVQTVDFRTQDGTVTRLTQWQD